MAFEAEGLGRERAGIGLHIGVAVAVQTIPRFPLPVVGASWV